MKLSEFILEINSSLPSIEAVKSADPAYTDSEAIESLERITLKIHSNFTQQSDLQIEEIKSLLEKTNIQEINIGGLNFFDEIEQTIEGIDEFACFNDFLYFGQNRLSQIVVYDHENEQISLLTTTVSVFLEFLILYNNFDKLFVYDRDKISSMNLESRIEKLIARGYSKKWIKDFFFTL